MSQNFLGGSLVKQPQVQASWTQLFHFFYKLMFLILWLQQLACGVIQKVLGIFR